MMASRVATRKFTSLTILAVGCGSRVVPPRPVGPDYGEHLAINDIWEGVFTMNVGRVDFFSAERLQRPGVHLDICPSYGVENRT